jgi:hypothetical protein
MMAEILFDALPHDGGTYEKLKDGRYRLLNSATKPADAAPAEPTPTPVPAAPTVAKVEAK